MRGMRTGLLPREAFIFSGEFGLLSLLLPIEKALYPRCLFQAEEAIEHVVRDQIAKSGAIKVGEYHYSDLLIRQEGDVQREAIEIAAVLDQFMSPVAGNEEAHAVSVFTQFLVIRS